MNDKHLRKIRGDIGMVFQHFNTFPHMTILENCMLAPTIVKKKDQNEVRKTALEMLDNVWSRRIRSNYYPTTNCQEDKSKGLPWQEH